LVDRSALFCGDRELTAVFTPGHAIDHFCFWDPAAKALFAGDMVVRGSTVMIPATEGGGLRAYLASLERLRALGPERIYPGHGPVIDDPLDVIAQYLEHRRMREVQVAACLADGVTDPAAIVARIYPDLSADLRPAARATIEAHLQKLVEPQICKQGPLSQIADGQVANYLAKY
jgi:glyoxylase-like metal-dependent hydrolase (beta-lactamase superfamily II)